VALVIGLRFAGGSRRTVRLGWIVLVGLGEQGVIGYVQYFNHLPAGLVWVHVASAVTLWIFVLQLCLSTGTGLGRPATRPAPGDEQAAGDSVAASPSPPIKTTIL
jgi:cytochrome c oxidase assembly protein subunit 15